MEEIRFGAFSPFKSTWNLPAQPIQGSMNQGLKFPEQVFLALPGFLNSDLSSHSDFLPLSWSLLAINWISLNILFLKCLIPLTFFVHAHLDFSRHISNSWGITSNCNYSPLAFIPSRHFTTIRCILLNHILLYWNCE